jgi:putative Mg2+ transporter-C (MgtC) family protein
MALELWILLRLFVAGVLGALVGYEREKTGKRAGLRTHMLVAMGAALFVSCNDLAIEQARHAAHSGSSEFQVQAALLSPVQAVATGIGFLGAGTIVMGRHRNSVHGLTTAASIWIISAVGLVVGFDRYLLASGATALILIVLHVLVRFEPPHDQPGADEARPPASPLSF